MTPSALADWGKRHAITGEAMRGLLDILTPPPWPTPGDPGSEAYVQSRVRLEAPRHGVWLTRNNVGALQDKTGRPVRFGLANETTEQNKTLKSGDLIGIDGRPIEAWEVGRPRGRFVSRECKHAAWSPGEDPVREAGQFNWARLILRYGGDAKIVRGEGSF